MGEVCKIVVLVPGVRDVGLGVRHRFCTADDRDLGRAPGPTIGGSRDSTYLGRSGPQMP